MPTPLGTHRGPANLQVRPVRRFPEDHQMTPKQEEALRDYLQEVIVPLIEEVLVKKLGQAMTFAKKELAEQPAQQEPVAWMFQHGETGRTLCVDAQQVKWGFEERNPSYQKIAPLYTSSPAQRTWVGLTEDEVALIAVDCSLVTPSDFYFYQAIEAKLKEKNT
jgi:hypothetical protein